VSILEVQVNGGWVDLDLALANGITTKGLSLRYKPTITSKEYMAGSFSEVKLEKRPWLDADEVYKAGNYWAIAPLRYRNESHFKEAIMTDDVILGSPVIYHGPKNNLQGWWAIVEDIDYWDEGDITYRLAFYEIDSRAEFEYRLTDVKRNDFTPAIKPVIPNPALSDGYYISKTSSGAYKRFEGEWLCFDREMQGWDLLIGWTDDTVRDSVVFMASLTEIGD
jgi:hypothetical protein